MGSDYAGPRFGFTDITGLAEGPNLIPHNLPFTPNGALNLRPGAAGKWGETQKPDATNFYITVGSGGATAGRIDWTEGVDLSAQGDNTGM